MLHKLGCVMLPFYWISHHNAPVIGFGALCIRPCLGKRGIQTGYWWQRVNVKTGGVNGSCDSKWFALWFTHQSVKAMSHQWDHFYLKYSNGLYSSLVCLNIINPVLCGKEAVILFKLNKDVSVWKWPLSLYTPAAEHYSFSHCSTAIQHADGV